MRTTTPAKGRTRLRIDVFRLPRLVFVRASLYDSTRYSVFFSTKADTAQRKGVVMGAQRDAVIGVGSLLHAPIQHRLEYFGLKLSNVALESHTRTVAELLGVFSEAVPG